MSNSIGNVSGLANALSQSTDTPADQADDFSVKIKENSGNGSGNTYGMDPGQFANSLTTGGQGSSQSWNSPDLTAKINADMKSGDMAAVNKDMTEQKQDFNAQLGSGQKNAYGMDPSQFANSLIAQEQDATGQSGFNPQ